MKKLLERVDLRVVRCTVWAYQRIAQECAKEPLSLAQAIDKLLKELDNLRAEVKPRLLQGDKACLAQGISWKCARCGEVVIGVPGKEAHINATGHQQFQLADNELAAHLAQSPRLVKAQARGGKTEMVTEAQLAQGEKEGAYRCHKCHKWHLHGAKSCADNERMLE